MTFPDPKYRIGDIVFHVTDDHPGVVTAYVLYRNCMKYVVAWNTCGSERHYDYELTTKRSDWDSSFAGAGKDD